MITTGLKQMAGRRLRMLFAKWTDTGWRTGLIGLMCGLIFQSTSGAAFIIASLIATGILTVRRAMPLIFWANAGASLLVLVAVLDVKVFFLFALGLAGIALAFEKPARYQPLATVWHRYGFVEGLDTLLITACDAAESNQTEDVELLIKITQDRGELLRAMRQNYMAKESSLTSAGKQLFLRITGLFETAVWILGRMAQLQRQTLLSDEEFRKIGSASFIRPRRWQ